MAISQNSTIAWSDIRALFDKANAELNRFGYTPDSPLNLQNQIADADIPNRLNSLIAKMKSNSFIVSGSTISSIANFTVSEDEIIKPAKLVAMDDLLDTIATIKPFGPTGSPLTCTGYNFCKNYAAGYASFNSRHGASYTSFNARHGASYTSFNARHGASYTSFNARHGSSYTSFNARHTSGFSGGFNGNFGTFNGTVTGACAMQCTGAFAFEDSTGNPFANYAAARGTFNFLTFSGTGYSGYTARRGTFNFLTYSGTGYSGYTARRGTFNF